MNEQIEEMFGLCESGDWESFNKLVNQGVDIKRVDDMKETSLHNAAKGGNMKIIQYLTNQNQKQT